MSPDFCEVSPKIKSKACREKRDFLVCLGRFFQNSSSARWWWWWLRVDGSLSNCRTQQQQWIFSTYKSLTCIFCTRNSEDWGGGNNNWQDHIIALLSVSWCAGLFSFKTIGWAITPQLEAPNSKIQENSTAATYLEETREWFLVAWILHDMLAYLIKWSN